ncbi:alpha/beta hydrolase family protein [Ruegeria arenilitoris]|uniref:alpha/beta hydrolase family protein n=1 Tax=Ruegeria arenilitoris TaxID=1173585 RepID=UPI00147B03C3|nr:alpha/beta hydrolase [Ruegeria arenilitoris]
MSFSSHVACGVFIAFLGCLLLLQGAWSDAAGTERLNFRHSDDTLAGRLLLPETPGPHPAVILVHGDGALRWDAYGYYKPFIQALNDAGFAVYSWDKPGVGDSTGNWLNQSMQDRADEVATAAAKLRSDARVQPERIGLMGFSQAGWVMPKAIAQHSGFTFMVSVSGAINWIDQSKYTTRNRLRLEGATNAEIQKALVFDHMIVAMMDEDADYRTYSRFVKDAPACCRDSMSEDRWHFVKTNFQSDVRADLRKVDVPVLALFGDKDLNVDYAESASVYRDILTRTPGADRIVVLPRADHSLLPTETERLVTTGPALTKRLIAIDLFGADAFANDAPGLVARWVSSAQHQF